MEYPVEVAMGAGHAGCSGRGPTVASIQQI
jgi:hypothetical protein